MSLNPTASYDHRLSIENVLIQKGASLLKQRKVAVIGGGRWGKIITRVLAGLHQGVSEIHLISNRNLDGITHWLEDASGKDQNLDEKVFVGKRLDKVIEDDAIEAVFVANYPDEHFNTAKALLKANKHVMVEKPFVSHVSQANELVAMAKENDLVLAVGLEFMLSSYIYHFRDLLEKYGAEAKQVTISWYDVFVDQRYGILKIPDMTVNVFNDIFPHILSILYVLFNNQKALVDNISIEDGGNSAVINLDYGVLPLTVNLSRTAELPCRIIKVIDQEERVFTLDMTKEPGRVWLDEEELPEDPYWLGLPGTLNMEFEYFLREIQERRHELPSLAEKTIGIVETVEHGNALITSEQTTLIRKYLFNEYPAKPGKEELVALREHLLLGFQREDLVQSPKDETQVNFWTEKALVLIHKFSYNPFATQRDLLKDLNIDKNDLIRLNSVVRESNFAQLLILEHGYGVKYWKNTIVPLIQSGVVNATISNNYCYPYRVGIYLGPSCMFSCSYCGREPKARYENSTIHPGNELFKKIFQDAPKDDPYRFYISGGLEPLTNQEIGKVVEFGTEQGFKLSLYTNGFLLTPDLFKRQPGLWYLDTLRISMHGIDEESSFRVTKNRNAFSQVIKNSKEFLRLRDKQKTSVKFGFNFVILPDCAEDVLKLIDVIAEINRESGADRQVNFLTLREDYSFADNENSKLEKRENLIKIFKELQKRTHDSDLSDLYIDFGYALYGTSLGEKSPSLYMADCRDIRPKGYPQISLVVDLLGDVYLYREAGFIERPGAHRYKIGRVSDCRSLASVVSEFVKDGRTSYPEYGDARFFDAFDHLVTGLLNQAEDDIDFGIPFEMGPVNDRIYTEEKVHNVTVAHPTLAHPTLPSYTNRDSN